VLGRREALAGQGFVNRGRAARLVHGGGGRHRVRDQVDAVVLALVGTSGLQGASRGLAKNADGTAET
jgi:hypothetical protein